MIYTVKIIAIVVGSYLIGNINIALLISKLKKGDVRKMGSGNPGTMNMLRNYGVKLGALTLFLDAVKGALPCVLGWLLLGGVSPAFGPNKLGAYIAGLSVIVGHIFPVFLKFKGGKGIASSIGICLVIHPIATLITFAVGVLFIFATQMGSITSFIIISIPLALEGFRVAALGGDLASSIILFVLFSLTLFAHRKNVVKLFTGKESKTKILKKRKKTTGEKAAVL